MNQMNEYQHLQETKEVIEVIVMKAAEVVVVVEEVQVEDRIIWNPLLMIIGIYYYQRI